MNAETNVLTEEDRNLFTTRTVDACCGARRAAMDMDRKPPSGEGHTVEHRQGLLSPVLSLRTAAYVSQQTHSALTHLHQTHLTLLKYIHNSDDKKNI